MPPIAYRDGFEARRIDPRIWTSGQIEPRQVAFSADAIEGGASVVVAVTDGDTGRDCDAPCQRAELRQHGRLRPEWGDEVWQGFSFRISGDIPRSGSLRTVIGQWKAPGDESPFLAQRFDNGVFHVTVQDGDNRMAIASAEGDPERLVLFQKRVAALASTPGLGLAAVAALRRGEAGAAFAAAPGGVLDGETEALFREFAYIQDLERYAHRPFIAIDPPAPEPLPDPAAGWVRMAYRFKGGRADNTHGPVGPGEVEIWADGAHVVTARGNLGYRLTRPPEETTVYFKFGVYRNVMPGTLRFHLDDFRQGTRRADVT